MVFEDLERIGALSRISTWDSAWDVMVEPYGEVTTKDFLEEDVLTLGYVCTNSVKTTWYHVLHQSRKSKLDFVRTPYDLADILHAGHSLHDSLSGRLVIAQLFTLAYVS